MKNCLSNYQPTEKVENHTKVFGILLLILLSGTVDSQILTSESYALLTAQSNDATVLNYQHNLNSTEPSQNFSNDTYTLVDGHYNTGSSNLPPEEPKSTHTWLDSDKSEIYNYDIDIRIVNFPSNPSRSWLYYFAIQVNFTDHQEWSHGGLQWSGAQEFANNNNQGVNWGGGSDWAGYGGIGRTNTPYTWKTGKWYRYRVWRLNKNDKGLWNWLFTVLDYETGEERQLGTVVTKSDWIKNANVWIETGYGVQCDTERAYVEWRNPTFKCTAGTFSPNRGTATYNGTCSGSSSTNQGLISNSPLMWFQSTKSTRTVADGQRLW